MRFECDFPNESIILWYFVKISAYCLNAFACCLFKRIFHFISCRWTILLPSDSSNRLLSPAKDFRDKRKIQEDPLKKIREPFSFIFLEILSGFWTISVQTLSRIRIDIFKSHSYFLSLLSYSWNAEKPLPVNVILDKRTQQKLISKKKERLLNSLKIYDKFK